MSLVPNLTLRNDSRLGTVFSDMVSDRGGREDAARGGVKRSIIGRQSKKYSATKRRDEASSASSFFADFRIGKSVLFRASRLSQRLAIAARPATATSTRVFVRCLYTLKTMSAFTTSLCSPGLAAKRYARR